MRVHLLFTIFVLLSVPAISQKARIISSGANKPPYMLVDSFRVDPKYLFLSPGKVESMTILKDSTAMKWYGEAASNGVVIINTKPDAKLLRINDILDQYKISEADKKLRICINKTLVSKTELILAEASEIVGLEITTDRRWSNTEDANTGEQFINIKTLPREMNDL